MKDGEKTFNLSLWIILIVLVIYTGMTTNWLLAGIVTIAAFFIYFKYFYGAAPKQSRHIPEAVKGEVLRIQQNKCAYCGREFGSKYEIEYHHIKPFHQGGQNTPDNITALHSGCHAQLTRSRK